MDFNLRRWASNLWTMLPWWARIMLVGIPLVGLVLVAHDLITGRQGGHEYATPADPPLGLAVCPSAQHDHLERLQGAAADYLEHTDCTPGPVVASDCDASPAEGWTQVRSCTDLLDDWPGGCPEGYSDRVGYRDGRGVAYVDFTANPHHVLGHASLRLPHTTAATSWMHGCDHPGDPTDERCAPGSQPTWIRCSP